MKSVLLKSIFAVAMVFLFCAGAYAATDKEFAGFAAEIERTMNAREPNFFDESLDYELITRKAVAGYDVDDKLMKQLVGGVKKSFEKNPFGRTINSIMGEEGSFVFLKMRSDNKALFRLISSEGGINYYELYLVNNGGKVRIEDMYVYSNGENTSDTFKRVLLPVVYESNKGILGKVLGWEGDFMKHLDELTRMRTLGAEGKVKESLDVYNSLPETLKKDKNVMLLRIKYTYGLEDDTEYKKALADFEKFFPEDPARDLMLIDYYTLIKKFNEAVSSINRLNKRVGEDAYLYYMRSNVYIVANDYAKAKESARKAIETDKSLVEPYWVLVSISLIEKNYKETSRILLALEKDMGVEMGDLQGAESYEGFVKSAEYPKWMKARK